MMAMIPVAIPSAAPAVIVTKVLPIRAAIMATMIPPRIAVKAP